MYGFCRQGAKSEAKAFVNAITPYKDITKFGTWFDMEDADGYKKKNGMPGNQTLRQMCAEFCKYVEDSGFYAGIYASESWFDDLYAEEITVLNQHVRDGIIPIAERARRRELLIVDNLLRDYTKGKGLVEFDGRK